MSLIVEGLRPLKGFLLEGKLIINQSLTLLVGRNGSGKTRFLESLLDPNYTKISIGDESLNVSRVKYFSREALIPKFNNRDEAEGRSAKVAAIAKYVENSGAVLDRPIEEVGGYPENHEVIGVGVILRLNEVHFFCSEIAARLKKKPSELTAAEIDCYYNPIAVDIFGEMPLTAIFKQYAEKKDKNDYLCYLNREKGEDVFYIAEEYFETEFGSAPWKTANQIMSNVFNGKFSFSEPSANRTNRSYGGSLVDQEGNAIDAAALSSGEQSLLWLAGVLIACQVNNYSKKQFPTLLLLDEPDAFLHPSMVVQMLGFMEGLSRDFNVYIVVATHSPTTVALANDASIVNVNGGLLEVIEIDAAISELLEGVTQISLSSKNRRQVFVESFNDLEVYDAIYRFLAERKIMLDPKISIHFMSPAISLSRKFIGEAFKIATGLEAQPDTLDKFNEYVKKMGGCSMVESQLKKLEERGVTTVRGIIDRDALIYKRKTIGNLIVLGDGDFYAIENIIFNPICTLLQAHLEDGERFSMLELCGVGISWSEWLKRPDLLQSASDKFFEKIFHRKSEGGYLLNYLGGASVELDKEYMDYNGHDLADKIFQAYDVLQRTGKGKDKKEREAAIMMAIVSRIMIFLTEGKFIPLALCQTIKELQ